MSGQELLVVAMYVAAVCHDFAHPGVTNDYLVKSRHPVAIMYNDRSPLENHHASASFQALYAAGDLFGQSVRTPPCGMRGRAHCARPRQSCFCQKEWLLTSC